MRLSVINWDTCTSDRVSFQRDYVGGKRRTRLRSSAYLRFYGRPRILWQLAREGLTNHQVLWASLRNLRKLVRGSESRIPLYIRQARI